MRTLPVLVLLAASAAAIDDLSPCQSRCYDQTADLVGCDADDYECACSSWDSRFAPQMSSCMIEGCAFGDEGGGGMGSSCHLSVVSFSSVCCPCRLASRVPGIAPRQFSRRRWERSIPRVMGL